MSGAILVFRILKLLLCRKISVEKIGVAFEVRLMSPNRLGTLRMV